MQTITPFLKVIRFSSCLAVISLLASPLLGRADSVLSLAASGSSPGDQWKVSSPSVTFAEGVLHIAGDANDPASYCVNALYTPSSVPQLNFLHNAVTIKIKNLDIKGDAPPANQVFCLFLINDKAFETADSSFLKFRIAADGTLYISSNIPGTNGTKLLWQTTLSLPVKSFTISLAADGAKFSLEDASGPKDQNVTWTADTLQTAAWDNLAPFIRIQGQRNPGTGSSEVTLGGFTVDSTPAATASK